MDVWSDSDQTRRLFHASLLSPISEDADGDGERWEEEGGGGGEGEGDGGGGGGGGGRHLGRSSSMEMISSGDEYQDAMTPASSDSHIVEDSESPFGRRVDMFRQMYSVDHSLPSGGADSQPSSADVCPVKVLFIVLHGGSILDSGQQGASSKRNDFATLQSTFESVLQSHYHAAAHHIALRLVHCPHVCTDTLGILSSLSPYSYNSQASEDGNIAATQDFVPLGAIALFATSSAEYQEYVNAMVCRANAVYREFLHSSDGRGFSGQVCLLADSTGSLLSYDALTRCHSPFMRVGSRYGSRDSMDALQDDAIKVNHPDGLDPDHSDPVLCNLDLQSSDPVASAQSRYRIERSRSEVSPPKNSDLMRTDSTRPRSQRNSARLSTSMSERDPSRRTSSGSNFDGGFAQFDFEVSELFMFGSPLALVLAYRRVFSGEDRQSPPVRPACHQVYNLFHSSDPMAVRLEPLLNDCFKYVAPVKVARYSKFPLGDGEPVHVVETVQSNIKLFTESPRSSNSPAHPVLQRQLSSTSINSTTSGVGENTVSAITGVTCKWWGTKRMDYVLYCPDILHSFPSSALAPLFHSSFWESADAAAFILRQVLRHEVTVDEGAERGVSRTASFKMTQPREKWRKRRTTIKVRNLQQNHRANDVIVLEDKPQTLHARFMYGSLDIVTLSGEKVLWGSLHARFMYGSLDIVTLSGEKVDINVMTQPSSGDWVHVGTGITDSHGRLTFTLDDSQRLSHGMYPVKCVVRGDHTSVDCFLTVLPPKTETVVFSIDGSFTASVSIMGKDPKVRAGAVDVVRHWQDLGYLILYVSARLDMQHLTMMVMYDSILSRHWQDLGYLILYVSARPDMQHRKVVAWLAQHNFPHGMVAFMDGLSKDPLRQKLHYLKHLYTEVDIKYVAAYGSSKDVTIYRELGLQAPQIFIVGKASKKQAAQAQVVSDGYAAHLNNLLDPGALRPATGNARLFLRKSCFRLPVASDAKKTAKRTVSYPGSSSKGGDFLRLPDAGPGPTKIIVPDIAAGEEDSYGGGAARARGMSPMVVKNSGSKTTTV
ncbi:hypothetical protein ACOMHN_035639 [Nucella lapillus]